MEQLGIQPLQIVMQIINFAVLLFLLKKFLYGPVQKSLDARKRKIEEGLKYTNQVKVELENTEKKRNDVLQKARDEGKEIITEAKKTAKVVEADIIEKAKKEAAQILEKARKEIGAEREQMERSLKKQTVELTMTIVEKVLKDVLDEKIQKSLIEKKMNELTRHVS